jgi:hypothetical protein
MSEDISGNTPCSLAFKLGQSSIHTAGPYYSDPSVFVRFTAPVKPGDALETYVWKVGSGPVGTTEVAKKLERNVWQAVHCYLVSNFWLMSMCRLRSGSGMA